MQILHYIYTYLTALGIFIVLDGLWLGIVAKQFYRTYLGPFMGDVQWLPAVLFYLLYIFGILIFAVLPAIDTHSAFRALLLGGLFGLIAYATYDLTNLATLKDWPLIVTLVDLVWGTILTSAVAFLTYSVTVRMFL